MRSERHAPRHPTISCLPSLLSGEEMTVREQCAFGFPGCVGVRSFHFISPRLCGGPRIQDGCGAHQVVRDDAEPDPPGRVLDSAIAAAAQPMSSFQHTEKSMGLREGVDTNAATGAKSG